MIERLNEMSKIADRYGDTQGVMGLSYEDSIHEATGKPITTYIIIVERADGCGTEDKYEKRHYG